MARRAPTAYRPSETVARNRLIDLFAAAAGGFTAQNYAEGGPLVTSDHPAAVAPREPPGAPSARGPRLGREPLGSNPPHGRARLRLRAFRAFQWNGIAFPASRLWEQGNCKGCAMRGSQIKLQSESPAIGGIYLGVTVSGVSALVAMGVVVLALM
jgi:hypothetical protein